MENLEKTFWDYFAYLPQHVSKWNRTIEEGYPYLKAFKNQLEQYRLVKSKKWNDEKLLELFPDIEDKLFGKLLNGIEEEMTVLLKIQTSLASLNRDLFRKYDAIYQQSKSDLKLEFTSKGTVVPPVWQLIELAENTKNYYAALYLQLDIALCSLKYEDSSAVEELENTIYEISKTRNEIKDALALTSFCRE